MFTVEQVLDQHFPRLSQRPLLKKPITYFLRRLLHESEFHDFAAKYPHINGLDFVEQVLDYFNFGYQVSDRELERIPHQGRVVIIANHPIGSLDGLALLKMVHQIRPDVKVVANELLMAVDPIRKFLLPVNNMSGNTARRDLDAINAHLNRDGALIIFPAGEVSRLSPQGVRDGRWRSGFVRIALASKSPILPIFVDARNSFLFYGTSLLFKPLSTLLLIKEMFAQTNKQLRFRIGEMIPYEHFAGNQLNQPAKVKLFKKHLYRLARNKRPLFRTEAAIAHPEDRSQLKRAISQCRRLGETPDNKAIYLYSGEPDSVIVRELGRLREVAFRTVGEGTGQRRDIDGFDSYYQHLLLWDERELEIVGAYRLTDTARVAAKWGAEGLYSHALFHYSEQMTPYLEQGLELGRSFVQPKYWGKRSLDYLWFGLGAFLADNPQYRYLFGPVTLSGTLPKAAKDLMIGFYRLYFGTGEDQIARSRSPYPTEDSSLLAQQVFCGNDYKQDFMTLKHNLDNMGSAIPTLYKQYSELCEPGGVRFLDFGVDPDFNNCIDGLVLVDLTQLKERKRQRYIGSHQQQPAA